MEPLNGQILGIVFACLFVVTFQSYSITINCDSCPASVPCSGPCATPTGGPFSGNVPQCTDDSEISADCSNIFTFDCAAVEKCSGTACSYKLDINGVNFNGCTTSSDILW